MTLLQAYLATDYQVYPTEKQVLHIRISQKSPKLDPFLKNQETWTFITAWNPDSKKLSLAENTQRNQQLATELQQQQVTYYPAAGVPATGDWTPEASFWVLGLSKREAVELGTRYGQRAIVWGAVGGLAELVFCLKG